MMSARWHYVLYSPFCYNPTSLGYGWVIQYRRVIGFELLVLGEWGEKLKELNWKWQCVHPEFPFYVFVFGHILQWESNY